MRRIIIRTLLAALLLLGWQRAWGFAFLGPFFGPDATWQTITLGYDQAYLNAGLPGSPNWLGDIGGPKNIGEAYRRNDPYIFYAYDSTFSGYFGLQGETNADQAFTIMNNIFGAYPSGVDGYSPNLTEFPFNSQDFNGTAQGYYLTDLKSVILHLLVEQMGLAEPERYTWTLHDRAVVSPPGCPLGSTFLVVQRNFGYMDQPLNGPETGNIYSPYVNNILYTYSILDDCGHHPPAWTAITVPFSVDTTIPEFNSVAANNFEGGVIDQGGLQIGGFYTGLTEDDVAGLRYLMSSNNIEFEDPAAGSQLEVTNAATPVQIFPLFPLLSFAQTNPPAAVQAFAAAQGYPNLIIDPNFTNTYTVISNSNPIVTSFFQTIPGQPVTVPPRFVVVTNGFIPSFQTNYGYTFDNLVTIDFHTNTLAYVKTISVGLAIGQPAGTLATNVSFQSIFLNVPSGQFYLLPTNSCGVNLVYTNTFFDGFFTNQTITQATNTTGAVPNGFVGSESIVVPLTNSIALGLACTLVASNGPNYYQGIQHVRFVRISDDNVDPLTDQFRVPVTNTYTMTVVTNHALIRQPFYRVVTQPDIVLSAFDDAQANTFNGTVTRNANFDTGAVQPGLSGPGVINGPVQFDFNKVGNAWWNGPFADTNSMIAGPQSSVNGTTGIPSLLWASFDGSTNVPVIYPNTASLQELQSQMIITVSPTSLPNGTNGLPYARVPFSATGGTPGYTWSLAPGSSLPNGLVFFGGVLSGTPMTTNGTYDVSIQLMDSSNPTNVVITPYTINLN